MWQQKDYEARATEIAKAYRAGLDIGGSDLPSLVEKTARDNGLLPEQIRRLSRSVNTAMFAEEYGAKTGSDRRVDFTPVDEDEVIGRFRTAETRATASVKTASYPSLPDPRVRPERVKTAAEVFDPLLPPPAPLPVRRMHAKAAHERLRTDLGALELRWHGALAKVAHHCDRIGHLHGDFEKNAVAVLGAECLPELAQIRESLKMAASPLTASKVAEVADFLVGVEDEQTRHIQAAISARHEYGRKKAALDEAARQLEAIEVEVSRVL